mmetsp:Transcript_57586/g.102115  ORF Transcript_57586/g.102115 Transcript_57586/m.102115 type:complete len:83 (+) Transcript_57586:1303-1551(+)
MHPSIEADVFATVTRRPRFERGRAVPCRLLPGDELRPSQSTPNSAIGLFGSCSSDLSAVDCELCAGAALPGEEAPCALNTAA